MARALRLEYPGAIYHAMARGNERKAVFRDDVDRLRFGEKLEESSEIFHIRLYAYCLMPNHWHLLLETPRGNLSAFMQQFNTSYPAYFNARHRRAGHLYASRYNAKLVEGDDYLLALTRYVHLNPVNTRATRSVEFAERRNLLRKYRWSSYRGYAGLGKPQGWIDYDPLLELVGQGRGKKKALAYQRGKKKALAYHQFVEAGLAEDDEDLAEAMGRSSKAVGTEAFCVWAEDLYRGLTDRQGSRVDVAMRRREVGLDPDIVLGAVADHYGVDRTELVRARSRHEGRKVCMWLMWKHCDLTQRQIAEQLGGGDGWKHCDLTQRQIAEQLGGGDGTNVSRALKNLGVLWKDDKRFQRLIKKLEREFVNA